MRKRSKYRPKGVILNPIAWVIEGTQRVLEHSGNTVLSLKIRNHAAMTALVRGKATKQDINLLINMINVCEALYRMGIGAEYSDVMHDGLAALAAVGTRGKDTNKFILWAAEMAALNDVMELHDAQIDVVTVRDLEKAITLVQRERDAGRMRKI